MTIAARASGSGRQPAEVEADRDLELESLAHHAEDLAFVDRVRVGVDRIVAAAAVGSRTGVVNEAGRIGYLASRRRAQLGSVLL
jgi:hypothetical protein